MTNNQSFRSLKTVLFIPADKPKFLDSAIKNKPDAVQLDLEDSLAPERKETGRQQLESACAKLSANNITVIVRVNNDKLNFYKDLQAALEAGVDVITIPKLETCAQVNTAVQLIEEAEAEHKVVKGKTKILGLIETVSGIVNRDGWCDASERLVGLALGTEDLCLELGCEPSFENLLEPCRRLLYSAREANLAVWAYPSSIANFSELDELEHAFKTAKAMGIDGAWCIHPTQVDLAKKIFSLSKAEIEEAQAVVNAFEEALAKGNAAVKHNNRMIDLPVYQRAKNILST